MRFCMITTFYPPHHFGGDAVGTRRLAEGLAAAGHEVEVVCDTDGWRALTDAPEPPALPDVPHLTVRRLRSRRPLLASLANHQVGTPTAHRSALRRIVARRFDVIHFHNVSLSGGPGLFPIGGQGPVKLVTAHDHWLVCPTSVLWRYDQQACPGRRCLRCQVAGRRPPQLWREGGVVARNLDAIDAFIAKSAFSRDKHREMGFPRPMEVLPYALPDREATETPAAPSHPRPFFLFVGRVERIKGLGPLIETMRRIGGADLLVAGDGSERSALEARAPSNVRFLGAVDQGRLRALYRDCVALIVPSLCFETFGLVVAEAMREGTPVLARDHGPLPELIHETGGGAVFRDEGELVAHMERLLGDPALRETLGTRGRAGWERLWSEDVVIPRYLALVERLRARKAQLRA